MNVVVVDDEPDVRFLDASTLRLAGYDVLTAGDGEAGLALIRDAAPAAAVVGVAMPKLDGLAVTRALVEDPKTAMIPVLLLSALTRPADRAAGLAAGAKDYLGKPFAPNDLVGRVAALIAARGRPPGAGEDNPPTSIT